MRKGDFTVTSKFPTQAAATLNGEGLAPGRAKGIVVRADEVPLLFGPAELTARGTGKLSGAEAYRLAVQTLDRVLRNAMQRFSDDQDTDARSIVEAQHCMLHDPGLGERIRLAIAEEGMDPVEAVEVTFSRAAERMARSDDDFLASRAVDIRELSKRLAAIMRPPPAVQRRAAQRRIVVADELYVAWILNAAECGVAAFVVGEGTRLSHAVILARSMGIPVLRLRKEKHASIVYGVPGVVHAKPERARLVLHDATGEPETPAAGRPADREPKHAPAVSIQLNVVDETGARNAARPGVSGIGLFRTEYLFMRHGNDFPSELKQREYYGRVFDACGGKPVTIRTVDIGGDKELGYFSLGPQSNPYLGLRGHRVYRYHPDIPTTQIRAILRAAAGSSTVRILYPMVETVDELLYVKELTGRAMESLKADGVPFMERIEQGVMIEVPSAAWNARRLLRRVDFACVGTNDLLQYFFAVDRNNANVQDYCRPEDPSVLAMFESIIEAGKVEGKTVTLCGELASDIDYLPLLRGLGFRSFSVNPYAVDEILESVNDVPAAACDALAVRCRDAATAREAHQLLVSFWRERGRDPGGDDSAEAGEHVDPVCGMRLSATEHHLSAVKDGVRYYFCTPRCMEVYMRRESDSAGERVPGQTAPRSRSSGDSGTRFAPSIRKGGNHNEA